MRVGYFEAEFSGVGLGGECQGEEEGESEVEKWAHGLGWGEPLCYQFVGECLVTEGMRARSFYKLHTPF